MPKIKEPKEVKVKPDLIGLLKARLPACFEREPAPAFAEGNLKKLVAEIESIYA